jgi:hypothetical protein
MTPVSRALAALLALVVLLAAGGAAAQPEAERLKSAKSLFFDKRYVEARELWREVKKSGGADARLAAFWIARCSDSLGENERALAEYSEYLAQRPSDADLAEEARTGRVRLATRLYEAGKRQHLPLLREALADPSRTVRYYAAFQLASLGPEVGQPAVPVLKKIIAEEKDEDLVERAKLRLLKVDPRALAPVIAGVPATTPRARPTAQPLPAPSALPPAPGPAAARAANFVRLRIFERGRSEAKVSINVPIALADLVFKSLPDDAKRDLRLKGYDADNFWERLKHLGPMEILEIVGDDGERIRIWIE